MPDLSVQEMAEQYGWSYAFLKSHPDVLNVFKQAVAGTWTPDHFTAQLKNTGWWKKNSDQVRQYQVMKSTNPGELAAKRNALTAQIRDSAANLGAGLSNKTLARVVENALMFGWNDAQVRDTLGQYVHTMNGVYNGQAATDTDQLKQTAWRNGVKMSTGTLDSYAQAIAKGNVTVNYYQDLIRKQAKTLAPGFADQLDSGMDLFDIANPYMQAKAQLLQLDPAKVDLFDTDVRSALSAKDAQGKPTSKSLWEFEQQVRQDPRYMQTDTARDQAYSTAHKVLSDMGFMS